MAKSTRPKGKRQQALADHGLGSSVYNKKRKVRFGTLVKDGWFSATPDDTGISRAIRTNNPGALNMSAAWQRMRPGFVGQIPADAAGNVTTIYQTPEQGIAMVLAKPDSSISRQSRAGMPARTQQQPRSRHTRTDGRNGPTVL
jgi:hypothetical protein